MNTHMMPDNLSEMFCLWSSLLNQNSVVCLYVICRAFITMLSSI